MALVELIQPLSAIVFLLISSTAIAFCSGKKKPPAESAQPTGLPPAGPPTGELPKKPEDGNGIADTHDPNYQTLAKVEGNVFGQDKAPGAGGPKPGAAAVADTHDPNYQTLAAVGGDAFGADKAAGGGGGGGGGAAAVSPGGGASPGAPKAGENAVAGTHDPNYQTLAAVGGDVFKK